MCLVLLISTAVIAVVTSMNASYDYFAIGLFLCLLAMLISQALVKGWIPDFEFHMDNIRQQLPRREVLALIFLTIALAAANLAFLFYNVRKCNTAYQDPSVTLVERDVSEAFKNIDFPPAGSIMFETAFFVTVRCVIYEYADHSRGREVGCGFSESASVFTWHLEWTDDHPWGEFCADLRLTSWAGANTECRRARRSRDDFDPQFNSAFVPLILCNNTQVDLRAQLLLEDSRQILGNFTAGRRIVPNARPIISTESHFEQLPQLDGTVRVCFGQFLRDRVAITRVIGIDYDWQTAIAQQASVFNISLTIFALPFPVVYPMNPTRIFAGTKKPVFEPLEQPEGDHYEHPSEDTPIAPFISRSGSMNA